MKTRASALCFMFFGACLAHANPATECGNGFGTGIATDACKVEPGRARAAKLMRYIQSP